LIGSLFVLTNGSDRRGLSNRLVVVQFTVFGLPVITWAVLTAGMIGIRTVTGAELQRHTFRLPAFLVESAILGGIGAVYLVTAGGYSPLLVATGYVAVGAVTVVWYWYTGLFDSVAEPTG
jgi:hypothetical protein